VQARSRSALSELRTTESSCRITDDRAWLHPGALIGRHGFGMVSMAQRQNPWRHGCISSKSQVLERWSSWRLMTTPSSGAAAAYVNGGGHHTKRAGHPPGEARTSGKRLRPRGRHGKGNMRLAACAERPRDGAPLFGYFLSFLFSHPLYLLSPSSHYILIACPHRISLFPFSLSSPFPSFSLSSLFLLPYQILLLTALAGTLAAGGLFELRCSCPSWV